jgi:hypothetical protein
MESEMDNGVAALCQTDVRSGLGLYTTVRLVTWTFGYPSIQEAASRAARRSTGSAEGVVYQSIASASNPISHSRILCANMTVPSSSAYPRGE